MGSAVSANVGRPMTEGAGTVRPIHVATLHRPGDLIGGIQKHYTVFAAEARKCGHTVDVLTPFHTPKLLWLVLLGIGKALVGLSKPLHAWWYEYTRLHLLKRALAGHVSSHAPSIIYAQDPVSAEAALHLKARGYPVEVVSAVHFNLSTADEWVGKGYLKRGGWLYRRMLVRDARVLPRLDRLVFVSHFMEQQVRRRLPHAAHVPSRVVPNFVPAPAVTSDAPTRAELISIGTLEPRKNQGFLLDVLACAHARGHRYRLTLAGDGPARGELQAKAKALRLDAFVTFLGTLPDAAAALGQHLVYVHAARMENLPLVLIEALAAGRPAFAAPVGGVPEVFRHGAEGFYWSLDDPGGAAEALIAVLEDKTLYDNLAAAARMRHARHFSVGAVQDELLAAVTGRAPGERAGR